MNRTIGVLISGRGSNLQALIDATRDGRLDARIGVVISNRADAFGLERAFKAGIDTLVRDHKAYGSREAYEAALVEDLQARGVDLVFWPASCGCWARPSSTPFPGRMVNIHPALLPAFPGIHGQRQALLHGVQVPRAHLHFVDADLDTGPIILQAVVPVLPGDTEDTLVAPHPRRGTPHIPGGGASFILDGRWTLDGRRLVNGQAASGTVRSPRGQGRALHAVPCVPTLEPSVRRIPTRRVPTAPGL